MKTNHDKGPQDERKRAKRITRQKKLHLSDGYITVFVTADLLVEHCYVSYAHACKIVNGAKPLTPALRELFLFKVAGRTPLGQGFYMVPDGLEAPNGYIFSADQLTQYGYLMQIYRDIDRDMKQLIEKVSQLEADKATLQRRIEWIRHKYEPETQAPSNVIRGLFGTKRKA